MTILDFDHGFLNARAGMRNRTDSVSRKREGSAAGFVAFWFAFFALVAAANALLGSIF